MEIPRNKPFLIDLVKTLGIEDTVNYQQNKKGGDKTTKMDYVEAIQKYYLVERYGSLDNVPQHLQLALKYFPQKATPRNGLKPKSKQAELWAEVWNSGDYIVEEKLDGMRFSLIYVRAEGLHCYSRHIDANEFLPIEITDNFYTPFNPEEISIDSFFLDSELLCKSNDLLNMLNSAGLTAENQLGAVTSLMHMESEEAIRIQKGGIILTPVVFDCLEIDGEFIIDNPLWERKQEMGFVVQMLIEAGLQIEMHKSYKISRKSKHKLFASILDRGGEGLVAKKINSVYSPDARINDWVKIKRTVSLSGDTISGFISGFKPGKKGSNLENMVGSLEISSNVFLENGEVEVRSIAWVKSFPDALRQEFTQYDSQGFPTLNPDFLNRVMDIDGQCFSTKSHHLVHAQMEGWREDLTPFECTIKQEFIESLVF